MSGQSSRNEIPFLDVGASYFGLEEQLNDAHRRVMRSGRYILGPELEAFEHEFADFCGAANAVGVGNGLDALKLILQAYGVGAGHEVIVPANTFIATWMAVTAVGARPVPVEPDPQTLNIDPDKVIGAITRHTKAIIAVHLHGYPAAMTQLRAIAKESSLRLIEDAAQAHGAEYNGQSAGHLGDAAAFSFYPGKNLGAFGDGGAIVSDDPTLIKRVRTIRNYGAEEKYHHDKLGCNSRLDEVQAAVLRVKLPYLSGWNQRRARIASYYSDCLKEIPALGFLKPIENVTSSWHLFPIFSEDRDDLRNQLLSRGINTEVHYPIPPHRSLAYRACRWRREDFPITEHFAARTLSLPIGPHLSDESSEQVIAALQESFDVSVRPFERIA